MTVTQADFTLERTYAHAPERVWRAWTDQATKERWFLLGDRPDGTTYRLDAREGGSELLSTSLEDGRAISFAAQYVDVVDGERLVYLTEMVLEGRRMSATLGVVTFEAAEAGTRVTLTEHGAYLDGLDRADWREHGTAEQLDRVAAALDR